MKCFICDIVFRFSNTYDIFAIFENVSLIISYSTGIIAYGHLQLNLFFVQKYCNVNQLSTQLGFDECTLT